MDFQRTLASPIRAKGIGLHSGEKVRMTIAPAPEDSGIVFIRKDVVGFNPRVPGRYNFVTSTNLGTALSNDDGTIVSTVEHLMAAFWGCGIDNAYVELDGPEVPIMDGSSEPFVQMMEEAGVVAQSRARRVIEVTRSLEVREPDKFMAIAPAERFGISLEIDFNNRHIHNQSRRFSFDELAFKNELSRARTFGFEHEVSYLRSKGLARGGSLKNAVVVGEKGVLNKEGLRYEDEFVRHKILDCIGDFYLTGGIHVKGHFSGYRSGHGLNNKLLRLLFGDRSAWRWVQAPAA